MMSPDFKSNSTSYTQKRLSHNRLSKNCFLLAKKAKIFDKRKNVYGKNE